MEHKGTRIAELDVIRCVCNYLVVLLHAWAIFQYGTYGSVEYRVWNFICGPMTNVAMPTLFFISGYLLMNGFTMSKWSDKMRRRVKRLAVPYIVWSILFVLIYVSLASMFPRLQERVDSNGLSTLQGILGKTFGLTVAPIDGPLWFLRAIFVYSLISPLIYQMLKKMRMVLYVLCVLYLCLTFVIGYDAFKYSYPGYSVLIFVAGCAMGFGGRNPVKVFGGHWVWKMIGWTGFVCATLNFMMSDLDYMARCALSAVTSILLVPLLFSYAPQLVSLAKVKGYAFFKDASFFAYAGHFLFCSSVLHLMAPLTKGMATGRMTLLAFCFMCIGLPLTFAVYICGKRLFPKVMKCFDGTL